MFRGKVEDLDLASRANEQGPHGRVNEAKTIQMNIFGSSIRVLDFIVQPTKSAKIGGREAKCSSDSVSLLHKQMRAKESMQGTGGFLTII